MSEVEWMDIFSDNLVSAMKDARITQRELADMTGLGEATISRYISRQRIPNIKAIINLAYALDCDVSDLIDFGDRIY